jgi:hypothetical protein
MVEKIILNGKYSDFLVEEISEFWCRCFLVTSDEKKFLGADRKNYIVSQLLTYFELPSKDSNMLLNDYKVSWILTLSETHNTLYCAETQNSFLLFWQSSKEKLEIIGIIEVEKVVIKKWLDKLGAFNKSGY